MDVWRLLGAATRRWYVFVAVAGLAVLAAMSAGQRVDPEFTSSSSLLLVPPATSAGGNPYQDLGTAAQSVAIVLASSPTRASLAAKGLSPDFDVKSGSRTPIMGLVVRANTAKTAMDTGRQLITMAQTELSTRQGNAGVRGPFQVTAQVLDGPDDVSQSNSGRLQVQVVVLGLGGALAFLLAVFFDDVLLLVSQRRRARAAGSGGGGHEPVVKRRVRRRPRPRPEAAGSPDDEEQEAVVTSGAGRAGSL